MTTPKVIYFPRGDNPPKSSLYYGQDVRKTLKALPEDHVHSCITSPPYWSLRSYDTAPLVWGGTPGCEHIWGEKIPQNSRHRYTEKNSGKGDTVQYHGGLASAGAYPKERGQFCSHCDAWLGSLGLEPTPDLFVRNLVEVFREVRRVLHPQGTLWLNLGDTYASDRRGDPPLSQSASISDGVRGHGGEHERRGMAPGYNPSRDARAYGLKHKDLVMIPFRVAMALQADGWWLRSVIPWVKRNPLPESITDRPTVAVEYIFLLSKSERYFYDSNAVRSSYNEASLSRYNHEFSSEVPSSQATKNPSVGSGKIEPNPLGRNRRNSDWFFDSCKAIVNGGQQLLADVDPTAFVVNTSPYKGAHFACWPQKLVEPMVKAGTSEKGVCSACGVPWIPVFEEREPREGHDYEGKNIQADKQAAARRLNANSRAAREAGENHDNPFPAPKMIGWEAGCDCSPAQPVRSRVLDPFSGSATTGLVAMEMGRDYIGTDLNANYLPLAEARLLDAPPPPKGTIEAEESLFEVTAN